MAFKSAATGETMEDGMEDMGEVMAAESSPIDDFLAGLSPEELQEVCDKARALMPPTGEDAEYDKEVSSVVKPSPMAVKEDME